MEVIAALVGLGVVAAAPRSRVLRPVAKAVLKSGMAVAGATVAVAAVITEEVGDLVAKARSEHAGETIVEGEATPVEEVDLAAEPSIDAVQAVEPVDADAPADGKPAAAVSTPGLRPLAKAAAKSGLALADAAKGAMGVAAGAAAVAGQQLSGLATSVSREKQAGGPSAGGETLEAAATEIAAGGAEEAGAVPAAEPSSEAPGAEVVGEPARPAADDLVRIDGIGPKTAGLLQEAGIASFAQLAATPVEQLKAMLHEAGPRFRVVDPTTWPEQAQALMNAPVEEPKPFDDADLVQINGVGPKTAALLQAAGISSVSQLAAASVEQLQAILDLAGPRYRIVDPASWPAQAQALLAESSQS